MSYPCDQIDCIIHPTYIEAEKERQKQAQIVPVDVTYNDNISNSVYAKSVTWESISKPHSYINVPCLKENIEFECFLCQYFKRQDMKTNLIVYNAKNVLNE